MTHGPDRHADGRRDAKWLQRFPLVTAVAALLTAGCTLQLDATGGGDGWPPTVPEIHLVLHDDAINVDRPVPAGRVVFRVHNAGSERHRVTLIPLPEDLPPIGEQLDGDERRNVTPLGATNTRPPGEGAAFAVDLEEGRRYAVVCFEQDDDGTVHARKGMNAEFRAGGPDAEPPD